MTIMASYIESQNRSITFNRSLSVTINKLKNIRPINSKATPKLPPPFRLTNKTI